MSSSSGVNKEELYGEFLRGQRWRERLGRRAAHKALDIADDEEMNINVRQGLGVKEMIALAVLIVGSLFGWRFLNRPPDPAAATDTDTVTVLEFDR